MRPKTNRYSGMFAIGLQQDPGECDDLISLVLDEEVFDGLNNAQKQAKIYAKENGWEKVTIYRLTPEYEYTHIATTHEKDLRKTNESKSGI